MTTCRSAATKTTATARSQGATLIGALRRHEHDDGVERPEVDVRIDLHLLEQVGVGLADARDPPDRDPLREERAQRPGAPAGGDDLVSDADDVLLADAIEHERLTRAACVPHDPGRARPQVDGGRGRLLVGEELDPRSAWR